MPQSETSPISLPTNSSTPDSSGTTPNATEPSSTPATSQFEASSPAAFSTESKKDEPPAGSTRLRRRVTRPSVISTEANDTMGCEEEGRSQSGASDLGNDKSDSMHGPMAQRKTLRSRNVLATEHTEDDASHTEGAVNNGLIQAEATSKDEEMPTPSTSAKEQPSEGSARRAKTQQDKGQKGGVERDNDKVRRRSTRISVLERAKEVVGKASSVLGKRKRDKDGKKAVERRASLRPRNVPQDSTTIPPPEAPTAKNTKLSSKSGDSTAKASEPEAEKPKVAPYQRKRWLSHGLYAGQYTYSEDPLLVKGSKGKTSKNRKSSGTERKLLPLPMYSGAKLLETGRDFKLPFDIFSPLPPGQPKPDEWRKTNKNVFVGDAASIWKATKLTEMSTCTCTPETGCDEDCQNRFMFYECDDTNCKLGEELCGNRSFNGLRQRCKAGGKFNIGVEVIKTEDRGYGVRSNRFFEPNQIIVEYAGEIVTQEECERRMRTLYKNNECYYLMYFHQNMVIDATRGSIARFVNHSCEPNCRMEKWTVAGKPRMALFAGENGIMTGEELTYDYNFDPYSQKNVQECRCGAPTCRGILGPRQNKESKDKQKKEPEPKSTKKRASTASSASKTSTSTKRKVESILDDSTSQLNKKRKIVKSTKASVKKGVKKAVSKTVQASKSTKAVNKTQKTDKTAKKSNSSKDASKAKNTKAKQQQTTTEKAAKGSKRSASTLAGGLQSHSRLRMPDKPRLSNSISAARGAENTPASMKSFLGKGKKPQPQLSEDDNGSAGNSNVKTRQTRARGKR